MNQSDRNKKYDKNVFIFFLMCSAFFGAIFGPHLWAENQRAKEEALFDLSPSESRDVKEPPKDMDRTESKREAKREELRIIAQSMRTESRRKKETLAAKASEDAKRLRELKRRWDKHLIKESRPIRKLLGTQTLSDRFDEMVGD